MESLASEVAPFGIQTMLVEPGFFRTELLTPQSTEYAEAIHRGLRRPHRATVRRGRAWTASRVGDPAKLADALVQLAASRAAAGTVRRRRRRRRALRDQGRALLAQADAHRELSSSLAHDD